MHTEQTYTENTYYMTVLYWCKVTIQLPWITQLIQTWSRGTFILPFFSYFYFSFLWYSCIWDLIKSNLHWKTDENWTTDGPCPRHIGIMICWKKIGIKEGSLLTILAANVRSACTGGILGLAHMTWIWKLQVRLRLQLPATCANLIVSWTRKVSWAEAGWGGLVGLNGPHESQGMKISSSWRVPFATNLLV
jgi:hypothetical protein